MPAVANPNAHSYCLNANNALLPVPGDDSLRPLVLHGVHQELPERQRHVPAVPPGRGPSGSAGCPGAYITGACMLQLQGSLRAVLCACAWQHQGREEACLLQQVKVVCMPLASDHQPAACTTAGWSDATQCDVLNGAGFHNDGLTADWPLGHLCLCRPAQMMRTWTQMLAAQPVRCVTAS